MRPRHDTSGERRRDGMRRPVSPAQSENQLQRNAGLKAHKEADHEEAYHQAGRDREHGNEE